jgi:hypothetical protein
MPASESQNSEGASALGEGKGSKEECLMRPTDLFPRVQSRLCLHARAMPAIKQQLVALACGLSVPNPPCLRPKDQNILQYFLT